jgi:hypothetical protein
LITYRQVRRLFSLIKIEGSLELAASKAGMDAKTARKCRRLGRLPSELEPGPRWRTRPDPFAEVWEAVRGLLESSSGLEAKTVFEHLRLTPLTNQLASAFRAVCGTAPYKPHPSAPA